MEDSPTPDPRLEPDQDYRPWLRGLGISVAGGAAYAGHRFLLATRPNYARKAYHWAKAFEDNSPYHMGRTLGISDRLASHLPQRIEYTRHQLVEPTGELTSLGATLERQFGAAGQAFDIATEVTSETPLVFARSKPGSAFLALEREGFQLETRFVPAGSRLAGAAVRLDAPLFETSVARSQHPSFLHRQWENFQHLRASQEIHNWSPLQKAPGWGAQGAAGMAFQPFATKGHSADPVFNLGYSLRNAWNRTRIEAFEAMERPQRLFGEVGFGLRRGSWNKIVHLPGFGEGGLLNGMLTRRVLPAALGITALGYLDYKLGHPSDKVLDLGLKTNVLRADLTDMVPGGRSITDFYDQVVPGPQYGPLALPALGAFMGGLYHYSKVLRGEFAGPQGQSLRRASSRVLPEIKSLKSIHDVSSLRQAWHALGTPGKGAALGLLAMLPFVPGMLGSRKSGDELRDIYSGVEPVPIRAGRWWELGTTALGGGRIKSWRPHWSVLHKSRAETVSIYGSEKGKWAHNPFLHPIKYFRDPYWLEKQHYQDRPYPVSSPAFSNVPLIGPLLAATVGKLVKPPVRMHADQWDGKDYTLYSSRLEPRGPDAIAPPAPKDEFGLGRVLDREATIFSEYTGLYGFLARSAWNKAFPDQDRGKDVYFQGSRQMESTSRRYYEKELGAGLGPSPGMTEHFGYTEPLRRFIQKETFEPQANEVPNTAPSWLPGEDYYVDFHRGDPFAKIDEGYARLPGAGYAALHPELKDVDPEAYPDIYKLAILGDVAPYSRQFHAVRHQVTVAAADDPGLQIELSKILDRVQKTKDSVIRMTERRFTAPVEEISGTVEAINSKGLSLREYPGRFFEYSSVGTSAADISAAILGRENKLTKFQLAEKTRDARAGLEHYLSDIFGASKKVRLVIPQGAAEHAEVARAVVFSEDGLNLNREILDAGYGQYREDRGGAEAQAMHGWLGRTLGELGEGLSFTGDSSRLNPLRYLPTPGHTKLWQERTPLAEYLDNEVVGTRMRRWERPIHDFLSPYLRGLAERETGEIVLPEDVQRRRDLHSLGDILTYLRGLDQQSQGHTNQGRRTSIGADLFSDPTFLASTVGSRDAHYFRNFLHETDPAKRAKILEVASPEMERALAAQWAAGEARIAQAEGRDQGPVGDSGRLLNPEDVAAWKKSDSHLSYGDFLRSQEIAHFFSRTGFALPAPGSPALDEALDYQDVQLKIVQQEGYDEHDFQFFDDRASLLWRKPYVDGAVRELTSGDTRSPEQLRRAVEGLMLSARDRQPEVRTAVHSSRGDHAHVRVNVDIDDQDKQIADMRRNPERYTEQ